MMTVPDFHDSELANVVDSLCSRSKAITYHDSDWTITRDVAGDEPERLNIEINGAHGQLRLSIWADRVLWFRLCSGRARGGWDFILSFHGDTSQVTPEQLVEELVCSMTADPADLLTVWQSVSPEIERYELNT